MLPSNKIKEYISLMVLIVIVTLLSMLPLTILSFLCSAVIIAALGYITTKYHYGYVAIAWSSIFLVYLIFTGNFLGALSAALPFALCGLTLGISYNLRLPPVKTLSIFTAVYTLNITASLKLTGVSDSGQNIFEEVIGSAGAIYRESLLSAYGTELSNAEISNIVSELTSAMLQITPSFIVIACAVFALLCFYTFKRFCAIRKADVSFLTAFSEWRAEKTVSIIYFVLLVLSLFAPSGNVLSDALMNMVIVMMFLFFLLGLSLVEHLLKKNIARSGLRKLILVAITVISLPFMGIPFFALSIAGALDGLMDYRQKKFFRR